jgi:aryl-alcohol dehydrogenase-like predicted oxidoreductase
MRYRRLGRTNLNISGIAYGGLPTVFQPPQVVIEAINYALDQGINYFDLDEGGNQFIPEKVYYEFL